MHFQKIFTRSSCQQSVTGTTCRRCPVSCVRVLLQRALVAAPSSSWLSLPIVHSPSTCYWLVVCRCPLAYCWRLGKALTLPIECWPPSPS
ncbi:hypothetical protein E2C01_043592 [Portunus trituberculatus]|uniref:Uncharacterized protein n=1 Tax=Portunus trituberculatus TaxID=210409 RepID=A0A5B7FXZ9_PORTR|nr:hypothetical protein [Portunus trituberculatus]